MSGTLRSIRYTLWPNLMLATLVAGGRRGAITGPVRPTLDAKDAAPVAAVETVLDTTTRTQPPADAAD